MDKFKEWLKKQGMTDAQITEAEGLITEHTQAAVDTEVAGLKKKNKELLEKYKNPDDDAKSKLITLETERDELKADLTRAQSDLATEKTKRTTLEKELGDKVAAADKSVAELLIDGGLTQILAESTFPQNIKALKALHASQFVIEKDEAGKPKAVAVIKDKDGKEKKVGPADYFKEWFASDEGKHFAKAPGGSGGGSGGSGEGAAGSTDKKARYDALNAKKAEELTPRERNELVILAADPEATKAS